MADYLTFVLALQGRIEEIDPAKKEELGVTVMAARSEMAFGLDSIQGDGSEKPSKTN